MFHAKAQRSTTTAAADEDINIVIFAQLPYRMSSAELEVFAVTPAGLQSSVHTSPRAGTRG